MTAAAIFSALVASWPLVTAPVLQCHKQDELGVDWAERLTSSSREGRRARWAAVRDVVRGFVRSEYAESASEVSRFIELLVRIDRDDGDSVALRVFERNRRLFRGGHAHAWGTFLHRIDREKLARTLLLFVDLAQRDCE
jgi:hypothetical protein